MKIELLEQLVNKRVILVDSEIEVKVNSLSKYIVVTEIKGIDIYGDDIESGLGIKIQRNSIERINGMEVHRIAELFNINMDGTLKKVGVRRGRKRKVR